MGSAFLYLAIVFMWLCVLVPMWLRRDRHHDDVVLVEPYTPEDSGEADTLSEPPPSLETDAVPAGTAIPGTPAGTSSENAYRDSPGTATAGPYKADRGNSHHGSVHPDQAHPFEPARPTSSPGSAGSPGSLGPPESSAPHGSTESTGSTEGEADRPSPARGPVDPRRASQRRRARLVARRRRRLLWSVLLVVASTVTAAVRVMPSWGVLPSVILLFGYLAVLRVAVQVDAERRQMIGKSRAERAARLRARHRALEVAAQQAQAEIIELDLARRVELFDQYADPPRRAVGD